VLGNTFPSSSVATVLVTVMLILALVLAGFSLLNKSVPRLAYVVIGLVEIGLIIMAVISVLAWIGGTAPAEPVVFICYLLACIAIPPAIVWWGVDEPGRWGSGVAAFACLTFAVLIMRVTQVWTGGMGP